MTRARCLLLLVPLVACSSLRRLTGSGAEHSYSLFQHTELHVADKLVALACTPDGGTILALDGEAGAVHVIEPTRSWKSLAIVDSFPLKLGPALQAAGVGIEDDGLEFLLVARSTIAGEPGLLQRRSAVDGRIISEVPIGQPTALLAAGARWLVASKAGQPVFDAERREFTRDPGDLTILERHDRTLESALSLQIPVGDVPGITTSADLRLVRLDVDWDGDGSSTPAMDFDGDGRVGSERVLLGHFENVPIHAGESEGESVDFPANIEDLTIAGPHALAASADGNLLYAALPTRNAIAVVNLEHHSVGRVFGLGRSQHPADLKADGAVLFHDELDAWREPLDIALAMNDRLLVTVDTGITHAAAGGPSGGARTVSVFDARTGHLIGDCGSALEQLAHEVGCYRDEFSSLRGSRPCCIVTTEMSSRYLALVGLGGAGALALIELRADRPPRVAAMTALARADQDSPLDPIAIVEVHIDERRLVVVAGERGTVALVELLRIE